MRLVAGLLATYPIMLLLGATDRVGLPSEASYLVVLLTVRLLLWWLAGALILKMHKASAKPRVLLWVLLGTCSSFTVDLVAWASGASFKFFC